VSTAIAARSSAPGEPFYRSLCAVGPLGIFHADAGGQVEGARRPGEPLNVACLTPSLQEPPMKLRALVVEDCAVMRRMLMQMLPLTGLAEFQFTEAEDGLDALARFHPDKTDIVFVDWKLPKLAGIDFVRKVRASGKTNHIPIVMVTGAGKVGNIEEALDDAGADVYITKPYTIEELRRKLAAVVERIAHEQHPPLAANPAAFLSKLLSGAG
jgi:two-component system, chemotaxis family, chemotaxis protein CheY